MTRIKRVFRFFFPRTIHLILAIVVCVVLPTYLVSLHISKNPKLSPIDEAAHYDYVTRMAGGSVPLLGQKFTESTMRVIVCRRTALHGVVVPPCSQAVILPKELPGLGYSYEAQQPPLYYATTAILRWVPEHLLHDDPFTAARLVGAFWLVLALLIFWAAARIFSVDAWATAAGCLILGVAPVSIYYSSIVSNDAADLFSGSVVLILGALFWRHKLRWAPLWLFIAGLILPTLKAIDILPVVVLSAFLLALSVTASWDNKKWTKSLVQSLRSWLPNGGMLLLGGAISVATWTIVQRKISLINPRTLPSFAVLRGTHVNLASIGAEATALLAPLTEPFSPLLTTSRTIQLGNPVALHLELIFASALMYFLVAAGLSGIFVTPRKWPHWLGLFTVAGLFFGGIALGISIWLSYNMNPGLSGKYGLALAPFLVLTLIALIRGRWALFATWFVGLSGLALDLWIMLLR